MSYGLGLSQHYLTCQPLAEGGGGILGGEALPQCAELAAEQGLFTHT